MTLCLLGSTAFAAPSDANTSSQSLASGEAWVPASSDSSPVSPVAAASPSPQASVNAGASVTGTPSTQMSPVSRGTTVAPNQDAAADADPEALTLFRADLEPYGTWIDDSRYGRIWVPNREIVGSSFSPYVTEGHWALDGDDNWVWVSDYPFGDIVFHYGRWFYAKEYGWSWVPGRTYAPSWVVWRTPTTSSYAYVGWAPMPPRFGWFSTGVVWYSSMPPVSYVFCPSDYLFYPSVGLYVVHDPWLVGRLGIYTSFYYPPYGYYGWGYYGYGYGGMGYHHTHHYGPPVYRTGISPRVVPRDRVAAQPRFASRPRMAGAGVSAASRSGRVAARPTIGSSRVSAPRGTSSWTAPRTSPLARSRATPTTSLRPVTSGRMPVRPSSVSSSAPGSWGASRGTLRPPTSSFSSSPRSAPAFRSSAPAFRSSAPAFRSSTPAFRSSTPAFRSSTPAFRSPSFRSSPSFRGGGRHR